ncbi:MAG: PKD domain-containing protein [Pseudomonadota bacterium]
MFSNVASSRGLTYNGITFGASWTPDANGDGRPDVWFGNHSQTPILYLSNASGGFSPSSAINGSVLGDLHGGSWGDFNGDGNADLYITAGAVNGGGSVASRLLINNGSQFTESAAAYGLDYPLGRGRHITWFDWNEDGYLDAIVVNNNDRTDPPDADSAVFTFNPGNNRFDQESWQIREDDNQTFALLTFNNPSLAGNLPAFIMMLRKGGEGPDRSYSYDTNGIDDVTAAFGINDEAWLNDAAVGDFDNDGDQDLITGSANGLFFYEQRPAGFIASSVGLNSDRVVYLTPGDFDNDGWLDLYVARGHTGQDTNLSNELFLNDGDGTFTQLNDSSVAGTSVGFVSGATRVDYNNDGLLDVLLVNGDNWFVPNSVGEGSPTQLLENQLSNGNHWLKIKLVGTQSNRDGIGATVRVTAGGLTQMREQNGGVHSRNQDDARLHFGLGNASSVGTIVVEWPSGNVQQLNGIAADQILTITENGGSGGNVAPVARITTSPGATPLDVDFDGSTSSDADGSITDWSWDFGDGNGGSGATVSHSYAADGTYTASLTVTDNDGATNTATLSIVINSDTSSNVQASLSNVDAGAKKARQERMLDTDSGGAQILSSFWSNNGSNSTAWATVELANPATIVEVRIATRRNRAHELTFEIGDQLDSGRVTGGAINSCSKPNQGSGAEPDELYVCTLSVASSGRYLTVSTNLDSLRIYGLEVWTNSEGPGNSPPNASFSVTTTLLTVDFDASASNDANGMITAWDWSFGDGANDSGEQVTHAYAANGTYQVTLTVTDDEGGTDSETMAVTVNDGSGGGSALSLTIAAVGSSGGSQSKINDTLTDGSQDLSSFWKSTTAGRWFTIDLGAPRTVTEIHLGPKANKNSTINFYAGDTLTAEGRVDGPLNQDCYIPISGSGSAPSALSVCAVSLPVARYITIEASSSVLRMYGIEVYE